MTPKEAIKLKENDIVYIKHIPTALEQEGYAAWHNSIMIHLIGGFWRVIDVDNRGELLISGHINMKTGEQIDARNAYNWYVPPHICSQVSYTKE